ncbi:MAG TPA: HlyD family efflux transporter periplasmic adaptor subunit, partial [Steroidobacteraceae bacterium]
MSRSSITSAACLAVLLAAGLTPSPSRADDEAAPAASALVQVAALKKGSLPSIVTLYGSAQASTRARQTIMAPASARVAAIDVRLGESVAPGASLLRLMPTPASAASYEQAKSALNVAQQSVVRTRSLLRQHLATVQQLNDAQKAEADARATLRALQTQGAGSELTVRAQFAATVTALSVSIGAIVNEGTALLDLVRPQALVVQAGAVPDVARTISVGDEVRVTPIGAARSLRGKVLLRGAVVDAATGLVPIEISLPADSVLPGEQAVAAVSTGQVQGYLVPHEAVLLNDEGNPYVVQVIGGVAHQVDVRVLGSLDNQD